MTEAIAAALQTCCFHYTSHRDTVLVLVLDNFRETFPCKIEGQFTKQQQQTVHIHATLVITDIQINFVTTQLHLAVLPQNTESISKYQDCFVSEALHCQVIH